MKNEKKTSRWIIENPAAALLPRTRARAKCSDCRLPRPLLRPCPLLPAALSTSVQFATPPLLTLRLSLVVALLPPPSLGLINPATSGDWCHGRGEFGGCCWCWWFQHPFQGQDSIFGATKISPRTLPVGWNAHSTPGHVLFRDVFFTFLPAHYLFDEMSSI